MGELEALKYLAPLGVGGVLAWAMFHVYRKDSVKWSEQETRRGDTMTQVVIANTQAITELIVTLRNGRKGD